MMKFKDWIAGALFALLIVVCVLLLFCEVKPQSTTTISRRCPGASPSPARAKVDIEKDGDITVTQCAGRSIFLNGATALTGSGTTNFVPRFLSASSFGNTPFSWDGTAYAWRNTGLTDTFSMSFTPTVAATTGIFSVGNASTAQIVLGDNAKTAQLIGLNGVILTTTDLGLNMQGTTLSVNSKGGIALIGDTGAAASGTRLSIDDTGIFSFEKTAQNAQVQFAGVNSFLFFRTITAGGTTGNATINRPAGTVNFAAGTSSLVLTNSTISANSIIFCNVRTNDATALSCRVTGAGAGSATVRLNANATAETSVGFLVTN